jgi:hypothetical protein
MRNPGSSECDTEGIGYRLVVEGELGPERGAWFGAISLVACNGLTTMELDLADQADLHGLLRRVRDMNLRIVELTRTGAPVSDVSHDGEAMSPE